jgi:hypothetical protein
MLSPENFDLLIDDFATTTVTSMMPGIARAKPAPSSPVILTSALRGELSRRGIIYVRL